MAVRTTLIGIEDLVQQVQSYWPQADVALLRRAYELAAQAHEGQMRLSGEPYVQHSLATAWQLAELRLDPATIADRKSVV